jgi:SNF2 family DNA or RNA helicase
MNLYPYQKKSVEFALKNPYCILALEVGLGKSLVALTVGVKTNSKMLVVCPAYLRYTWKNEIIKFYPDLKVSIFDSKKNLETPADQDIIIISYNLSDSYEKGFEWCDLLICDEAHNLKSMKAKRTEAIHKHVFENSLKRVLLLTGTPIQNRVWEFYSLMAICNYCPTPKQGLPASFLNDFPSYIDFADFFSNRREFEMMVNNRRLKVVNWEGFKNVEILKGYLKDIYIKFKSKDVLLDLPDKIYKEILISNTENKALLEEYERIQDQDDMDKIRPPIKAMNALSKVDFTIEYVKDLLETTNKVLVYSDHVDAARALAKGFKCKAITGSMSMNERQNIANEFQHGTHSVLVATIGSFSTGVTLTSCCNTVFNDLPWTPSSIEQAEGRTFRIGQKSTCVVHKVFGSLTDQSINQKLFSKKEIISVVT